MGPARLMLRRYLGPADKGSFFAFVSGYPGGRCRAPEKNKSFLINVDVRDTGEIPFFLYPASFYCGILSINFSLIIYFCRPPNVINRYTFSISRRLKGQVDCFGRLEFQKNASVPFFNGFLTDIDVLLTG